MRMFLCYTLIFFKYIACGVSGYFRLYVVICVIITRSCAYIYIQRFVFCPVQIIAFIFLCFVCTCQWSCCQLCCIMFFPITLRVCMLKFVLPILLLYMMLCVHTANSFGSFEMVLFILCTYFSLRCTHFVLLSADVCD